MGVIPVLLVTGPIGVGKSTVLLEADALLIAAGAGHATVELEDIARCWTDAANRDRAGFVNRNLAALWTSFASLGATRLLLSGLIQHRSELPAIADAVPGAALTVVRLPAPLPVLERRIRRREPGPPEGELDGAQWWSEHFATERVEDHLVQSDDRGVEEIAREVLRVADWLP